VLHMEWRVGQTTGTRKRFPTYHVTISHYSIQRFLKRVYKRLIKRINVSTHVPRGDFRASAFECDNLFSNNNMIAIQRSSICYYQSSIKLHYQSSDILFVEDSGSWRAHGPFIYAVSMIHVCNIIVDLSVFLD